MNTSVEDPSTRESYQLTSHPIGSKREFWALTWPLMIGLLSSTCMLFVDRLFLARWNPLGLNAAVSGGMAYYLFLVIPMAVVEIAEVLVGRLNGENRHREIGTAAWQMLLFSLSLFPVFCLIAKFAPHLFFHGSGNEILETDYFRTLMVSGALQCTVITLSGFFIGIGNVKIVTFSALMGNLINIILDYWMIFGVGPIPSLGVVGAALATGISLLAQTFFLLTIYWKRCNRKNYGTASISLNTSFLFEGLRIGFPSGAGRSIEVIAHFLFFRIVMSVGPEQMALAAIAQTLYILASFVVDAQNKTASAIASNLLGARQYAPLGKTLKSGCIQHFFFFLVLSIILWGFPEQIFSLFNAGEGTGLQPTPELMTTFKRALVCVSLFFLLDGFSWIFIGFLTSAKDTTYVFWVSVLVNWIAYIPPIYWFCGRNKGGADVAWMIIVGVTAINVLFYLWRYFSGSWLKHNKDRTAIL